MRLSDGEDPDLDRREPWRKPPAGMFQQDAEETLPRPQDGPVDNHGRMQLSIRSLILQTEAPGSLIVQLDRAGLPRAPQAVSDMNVDLGPVDRAFPGRDSEWNPGLL